MKVALVALALAWSQGVEPPPERFTVAATGDFLIHSPVAARALADGGGRRYDFRPMFSSIAGQIAEADLALCHIETPLVPGPVQGYPSFRTPPALARSIREVGWDACSTASNHSLDAGSFGVRTTLEALDRAGVRHAGTARSPRERRRPTIVTTGGLRIALLSYTAVSNGQPVPNPWTVNFAEAKPILAEARRARRLGADTAIVNMHWGDEYVHEISPSQLSLARRVTRSPDIAAIVGQHAHVVQPIRWVNDKPVVFGEGNLVSNQTAACCPAESQDGLIALLDFAATDGRVGAQRVRYVPTFVRHPDYRVLPAAPGSLPWNRTVSVAGRRPRVKPVR